MKLATFIYQSEKRIAALGSGSREGIIYDLSKYDSSIPADMLAFLDQGETALKKSQIAIEQADGQNNLPLSEVRLLAPVPAPRKIIGVGLNYRDHAKERGKTIPCYPLIFSKFSNAVHGPYDPIVIPKVSSRVDYECELGVVMGRKGRYISQDDAMRYVAGFVAVNDVSARDYQQHSTQYTIGKTFDTFCPMGPALVTLDEFPDPFSLDIKTSIDGAVLQHSNTSQFIFPIPYLISYLSGVMTLMPGDVILTGTPSGVGDNRSPQRYLQPGQVCRIEIEGIGMLENPVVAEA